MQHPILPALGFALVLAALAYCAEASAAGASYRGGAGVGFQVLRDKKLGDLYGSGASFHLMGEADFDGVPMSLAAEVGYAQSKSDHLLGPFFASDIEGTLRRIPIDLVARFPFTDSEGHPYVGAGLELLRVDERFTYTLEGTPRRRDVAGRFDPGALVVLGYERSESPRLRLEAYLTYVPANRRVARGNSYEAPGSRRIDEGSMGARIYWRLP